MESKNSAGKSWRIPRSTLRIIALGAIITLAAFLRFANLGVLGEGNHYYTATVESMLQSWHNFFFAAAEPGGSVSVDKPPLGFWLQAISAYFLGVNGLGVMLPQLIAGVLSVIVVYHLVRRSFGEFAGLLAGLVLAITPVVVATDRNNTIDSTLIFTLLLATWAYIKATETGKLRFLLLGSILVGIGFNIKMMQAYLPLPAFFALYIFGCAEKFWRKVGKLILATGVLLIISLSWAVVVDLTPASQRPYVGGSRTNSVMALILNYNGIERLTGMGGGGSPDGAPQSDSFPGGGVPNRMNPNQDNPPPDSDARQATGRGDGYYSRQFPGNSGDGTGTLSDGNIPFAPGGNNAMTPPQGAAGDDARQQGQAFDGGRPGGVFAGMGERNILRLFTTPLSKEVSWLLPFGLVGMLLLLAGSRSSWQSPKNRQAFYVWGGWLITCVVFFSVAGFFHEYYLSMLAPPLAALVGIGIVKLWQLFKDRKWLSLGLALLAIGGTLAFQLITARAFVNQISWSSWAIGLFAAGGLLMVGAILWKRESPAPLGYALLVGSILLTPAIWSGFTTFNTSANQGLPSAYSGGSIGITYTRELSVDDTVLDYLQSHTQNIDYLVAVPSAQIGSDYVLATGLPVLYLGGFGGQDQVVSLVEFIQMIEQGELRYVLSNSGDFGSRGTSDISSWISSSCMAIQNYDLGMGEISNGENTVNGQYGGFPQGNPGGRQGGNILYDCGE